MPSHLGIPGFQLRELGTCICITSLHSLLVASFMRDGKVRILPAVQKLWLICRRGVKNIFQLVQPKHRPIRISWHPAAMPSAMLVSCGVVGGCRDGGGALWGWMVFEGSSSLTPGMEILYFSPWHSQVPGYKISALGSPAGGVGRS